MKIEKNNLHTIENLIEMQNRTLSDKIQTSFAKIMEYFRRCDDKV